ncbi:hypothetical protein Tco_1305239, partial [Tanacetum coccineum]
MLLTHGSLPWNKGEQRSRDTTSKYIYSLPLQRYQPSSERPRFCLLDLMKGGEGKRRARAYGGEDKLLKLDEDQVQASPNYKAKIKTQSTSTAFFIIAMFVILMCFQNFICHHQNGGDQGKQRVRAYEGEDKLLKLGEDQVQANRARAYKEEDKLLKLGEDKVYASPNYKAKIRTQATLTAFFIFA